MLIDNFELIKERILSFASKGDFFFVLILKRRKDTNGKMLDGVNEDNRLIKHYFIYDREYLDRKADAIRKLCDSNDARAYILPQRRNSTTVLWNLHKKTADLLETNDQGVHFDHLIRSCVAGCHKSDREMWVIDLDRDSEYLTRFSDEDFNDFTHDIVDAITEVRRVYGQPLPYDCTIVPTPHGCHIVTEPFNKMELVEHERTPHLKELLWVSDWLKEDAMTLLYSNIT